MGIVVVRDAARRGKKYEAAVDGEMIGRRVAALKSGMVEGEKEYQAQIVMVEEKVKVLCEAAGVSSMTVAQYVNVGRKCYSLARRFSGATRDEEANRVVAHWVSRGLNSTLVVGACRAGGCDPSPPTPEPQLATEATLLLVLAQLGLLSTEATLAALNTKIPTLGSLSPGTVTATSSGNTEVIGAPAAGHRIRVTGFMYSNRAASVSPRVTLRFGVSGGQYFAATLAADGGMVNWNFTHQIRPYWEGGDAEALYVNLGAAGNVDVTVTYYIT